MLKASMPRHKNKQDGPASPARPSTRAQSDFAYSPRESIGYLMRITLRGLRTALKARLAVEEVPWGIWFFLRVLWEEDGLTQRELTERVGVMQPTTVSALRTMQQRGLVRVSADESDRRKMRIWLTASGKRLRSRLLPDIAYLNDEVALKGFSDREISQLTRQLLRIKANLDEYLASDQEDTFRPGSNDE